MPDHQKLAFSLMMRRMAVRLLAEARPVYPPLLQTGALPIARFVSLPVTERWEPTCATTSKFAKCAPQTSWTTAQPHLRLL